MIDITEKEKTKMKKSILIVNDETTVRNSIKKALSESGYTLLEAGDGTECISLAIKRRPDLIILDVIMPGLDEFTTLARLKNDESTASIPVIIFPLGKGKIYRQIAVELGATDFLSQSGGMGKIKKKVEMILA